MEGRRPGPPADWGKAGNAPVKDNDGPSAGAPLGPAAPQA